jgi:hypothetical protein
VDQPPAAISMALLHIMLVAVAVAATILDLMIRKQHQVVLA